MIDFCKYNFLSLKIIEKVEKMDKWLRIMSSKDSNMTIYNEEVVLKIFEFNKDVRKYVKEPSSTILRCEEFLRSCMETRASFYVPISTIEIQCMVVPVIEELKKNAAMTAKLNKELLW